MHHDLKCVTKHFQPLVDGKQKAEVRYADRKYQIGDTVTLHEGDLTLEGFEYTGRKITAQISFISYFGCQPGYAVLSYSKMGMLYIIDEKEETEC